MKDTGFSMLLMAIVMAILGVALALDPELDMTFCTAVIAVAAVGEIFVAIGAIYGRK